MDESWRMRMGMQMHGTERKSMTEGEGPTRHSFTSNLDPDDFSDVFGGPPRILLACKLSQEFTTTITSSSSHYFYADIFRTPSPKFVSPTKRTDSGSVLPAFRIPPPRNEEFYGDVFTPCDGQRSRERSLPKSKSKSNSSSVLSSEDLSPLRPVDGDDVALSSFASKLRPINVPCTWNSAIILPDDHSKRRAMLAFQCNRPSYSDYHYRENDHNYNSRSAYYGFPSRHVSSPESISLKPNLYRSTKPSLDDQELNSPSSPASSIWQEPEPRTDVSIQGNRMQEQVEQEEDEVMSSYVIEINSDHRGGNAEAVLIDEAIAWAKEKFQSQNSSTQPVKDESAADTEVEQLNANEFLDVQVGHGTIDSPMEEQKNWIAEEGKEQSEENMKVELLEEGRNKVLWPSSGWYAVPLTSLVESSHVKKAYQRARLCLHPDKLQQRGATIQQKYVAEKIISILQSFDKEAGFKSKLPEKFCGNISTTYLSSAQSQKPKYPSSAQSQKLKQMNAGYLMFHQSLQD